MGEGLSRRDLLKRGAIAGGALWATPIMHSVGIAQSDSEDTSPRCQVLATISQEPCNAANGNRTIMRVDACVVGCVCADDALRMVITEENVGEYELNLYLSGDGCGFGYDNWGYPPSPVTLTVRVECRDEFGAVLAKSADEVVTLTPCSV